MSVKELQSAVSVLPRKDLEQFARWFEEFLAHHDEREIALRIARFTPTNDQLLKMADKYPPDQRWFDEDELPW